MPTAVARLPPPQALPLPPFHPRLSTAASSQPNNPPQLPRRQKDPFLPTSPTNPTHTLPLPPAQPLPHQNSTARQRKRRRSNPLEKTRGATPRGTASRAEILQTYPRHLPPPPAPNPRPLLPLLHPIPSSPRLKVPRRTISSPQPKQQLRAFVLLNQIDLLVTHGPSS